MQSHGRDPVLHGCLCSLRDSGLLVTSEVRRCVLGLRLLARSIACHTPAALSVCSPCA